MSIEDVNALASGTRLNQYEIQNILGSGGFGITYLARDTGLDALVAIKEYLPSDLSIRQDGSQVTAKSSAAVQDFKWGLDRFLDEARVLAKFTHQHVVHIFQVFEANNTAYIVMEYAHGVSLSEYLKQKGPLGEAETRAILFPILDGLKRIHDRGFLHRDIKPGNIILREEGGPVLIDFGAARQAFETKSRSITSIITEGYAPLEQYDPHGNQGAWTDIYALGAVTYKCLTGNTPASATSRVRNDPLIPLQTAAEGRVSPEFASAIEWALSTYEENRPQSVEEFIRGLHGEQRPLANAGPADATKLVSPEQTQLAKSYSAAGRKEAAPPSPSQTQVQQPPSSRRGVQIAAAAACLVVLLAAGGWYFTTHSAPPHAAGPTPQDQTAWQQAATENSLDSYATYLRVEPDGYYVSNAKSAADTLHKQMDTAWDKAKSAGNPVAVQAFIDGFGKNNPHLAEANALLAQLRASDNGAHEKNVQIENRLVKAGFAIAKITGDPDETAAAIKGFQQANHVAVTGQIDPATETALAAGTAKAQELAIAASAKNKELADAYARALATHTRAGYTDFIDHYGASTQAGDVRSRLSQCHMVAASQPTTETQVIQRSSQNKSKTQTDLKDTVLQGARSTAFNEASAACSSTGGSVGETKYSDNNECIQEPVAGFLKAACGLAGSTCGIYTCTTTVSLSCNKTVVSNQSTEVCP